MGKNFKATVKDGVLRLRVKLGEGELSSSKKSMIVAINDGMFEKLDDVDPALEGHSIKLMVLGPVPKSGKKSKKTDDDSIVTKTKKSKKER